MLELLNDDEVMQEYVLGKIIRYNHRCRLQDESVATHSFFVSLFCLKIMAKLKLSVETERQVLILAALHDTPESKTSDIPHDVKSRYPEMEKILAEIEDDYFSENWSTFQKDVYKPQNIAYNIVKLADAYSVYQYCLNEMSLGNMSNDIMTIKTESVKRIFCYTEKVNSLLDAHLGCEEVKNERI